MNVLQHLDYNFSTDSFKIHIAFLEIYTIVKHWQDQQYTKKYASQNRNKKAKIYLVNS